MNKLKQFRSNYCNEEEKKWKNDETKTYQHCDNRRILMEMMGFRSGDFWIEQIKRKIIRIRIRIYQALEWPRPREEEEEEEDALDFLLLLSLVPVRFESEKTILGVLLYLYIFIFIYTAFVSLRKNKKLKELF